MTKAAIAGRLFGKMRTYVLWMALLISSLGALGPQGFARPAEVILLRHGEKPLDPNDVDLAPAGIERAQMLACYLTSNPALTNAGMPSVLFATAWTRHSHSRRPHETLQPLAKKLHLPIRQPFLAEEYEKLAKLILNSPDCDGKVVVVCWVHDNLPELAKALGVHPKLPEWKGQIYDRVWKITWTKRHAQLEELREPPLPHNTPGD